MRAAQVVAPLGHHRGQRGDDDRDDRGEQRGEGGDAVTEGAEEHGHGDAAGQDDRGDADRVPVVEHAAAELRDLRGQAQDVLVDDNVRGDGEDPGDGEVRVEAQHEAQDAEHVELHQRQRDADVEDHEPDPARVLLERAGVDVRPGQGTAVGVGGVDLDLGDDHQDHRERDGEPGGHHLLVLTHELVDRFDGDVRALAEDRDHVDRQEDADDLLDRTEDDPARATADHRGPPGLPVGGGLRRHEAQVVDVLGDLGGQREADAGGEHHRGEGD